MNCRFVGGGLRQSQAAQTSFKLTMEQRMTFETLISLTPPPKSWYYRHLSLRSLYVALGIKPSTSYMPGKARHLPNQAASPVELCFSNIG